jgi:gluconate 2-dehydrogenase gamma chain
MEAGGMLWVDDKARGRTLAAAAARILPSDDDAGAAEAGVAEYIARQLESLSDRDRHRFLEGLDLLEAVARQLCRKDLADCDAGEQDTVLRHVQNIPHALPRAFFRQLITLTLEGFLCDPVQGGNRNAAGWRYIGHDAGDARPGYCLRSEDVVDAKEQGCRTSS